MQSHHKAQNLGFRDNFPIRWRSGDLPNKRAPPSNMQSQDSKYNCNKHSLWKADNKCYLIRSLLCSFHCFLGSSLWNSLLFCYICWPHLIRASHNLQLWGLSSLLILFCSCRKQGGPKLFYALMVNLFCNSGYWNFWQKLFQNCGLNIFFFLISIRSVQIATPVPSLFWDMSFSLDLQKTWATRL